MFKEIRRRKQALPAEEVSAILHRGTSGVLALSGDDGYPYAIPTNYVFDGTKLYSHYTKDGRKLDTIQRSSKASFCIIDQDQVVPKRYTTYFRSAIAFGQIRIIQDEKEKRAAIEKLAKKYSPDENAAGRRKEIDRERKTLCMLKMYIDHMTGKEAIELVEKRQENN